jgi:predicted metal-dependent hydrolase
MNLKTVQEVIEAKSRQYAKEQVHNMSIDLSKALTVEHMRVYIQRSSNNVATSKLAYALENATTMPQLRSYIVEMVISALEDVSYKGRYDKLVNKVLEGAKYVD